MALLSLCCTRIDVAPTCPADLNVGEEGAVAANPIMPGAVPTYTWEVIPAQAGEFDDPTAPNTTFRALQEGEAIIQLTASDSLFGAIGECRTTIGSGRQRVAVSLVVDPLHPTADSPARLVCTSTGATSVATFEIEQTTGQTVTLTQTTDGVFLFTPNAEGELTFQCVGLSASGVTSAAARLSITVTAAPDDDSGRPPSRTGRR